jgi:hypothetical protein
LKIKCQQIPAGSFSGPEIVYLPPFANLLVGCIKRNQRPKSGVSSLLVRPKFRNFIHRRKLRFVPIAEPERLGMNSFDFPEGVPEAWSFLISKGGDWREVFYLSYPDQRIRVRLRNRFYENGQ